MTRLQLPLVLAAPLLLLLCPALAAPVFPQQPAPTTPAQPAPTEPAQAEPTTPAQAEPTKPAQAEPTPAQAAAALKDAEREAITVTRYDLDLHLTPAESRLSAVARLSLRNDGKLPLSHIALELSSTLDWEAISGQDATGVSGKLPFEHHRLDTDTDHTGAENEAVISLPRPLAPAATIELTTIYSGSLARSSARLERSGAPAADAERADWDGIAADGTYLRGFGNVLWYPVSAPQIFLGDGAHLAEAVGRQRERQRTATARVRLQIEYTGKPPASAFFAGRSEPLRPLEEDAGASESQPAGIALAEFAAAPLGFGTPSLFVVETAPQLEGRTVGIVTDDTGSAERVEGAAKASLAVVTDWLGALRERQPILLDHLGQPFAQGALLVESADEADNSFAMTHLLSHAWFASDEVWLDEGVAQFLPLVAMEREHGRPAALAQLEDQRPALVLAESSAGDAAAGGLPTATREVFYRNKAVAVLWMLRGLAGDDAMKKALTNLRSRPPAERDAKAFQTALEGASGKDLAWFFNDWVIADKGLPELSIVSAAARVNPGRQGIGEGYLVAVEVRNEGAAVAEVPITVRSGELTATERLRIPGNGTASTRIVFQGKPQQVEVNDGSVPEVGSSRHLQDLAP